jgi:hypothetical protein
MKRIALLVIITAALASCKSFQINTVSSINAIKNDSTGIFNIENDSLIISYNFKGNNSPLNVEVFNKLDEPLFINWERSAVIVDGKAYSYVSDNLNIKSDVSASTIELGNIPIAYTDGTVNTNVKLSKNESFVPPHSKTGRTIYALNQANTMKIDKSAFTSLTLTDADGLTPINGKTVNFSPENSPLKFKSYLTLYTLKDNIQRSFASQHSFYISSVTKVMQNPKNVFEYEHNPGDILVNSKSTGFGKTMAVVGVVGVIGAGAALESNSKDKNQ